MIDLHTHTNASDGSLSPGDLVSRAMARNISCLSITDHDSLGAYDILGDEVFPGLKIIAGVEFSTTWMGRNIHVLGLNVDPGCDNLRDGIRQQRAARHKRAEKISARLAKSGIENLLAKVTELANGASIGRPHFARVLLDEGKVSSHRQAYRRYLGNGKPGDVRQYWADLPTVIDWIRSAGGTASLAHPAHYRFTNTKLQKLVAEFAQHGGEAIEVCNGLQCDSVTEKIAELCNQHRLMASCGSDFHRPGLRWSELGLYSELPASCQPVWERW